MKKIFLYSSIALLAFTASCRNMDDNVSPNNVDPSQISPRQMLTAAQNQVFTAQAGTLTSLSNIWTNTWAGNDYYFGNPLTREYSLDISNTLGNGIWNANYIASNNLQKIIDNGSALPFHSAIARILKAYSMQYLVDFYGDIPYSEAFKGQANLSPKYDDDAAVYKNLVLELNKAIHDIETIAPTGENSVNGSEDVIFGGDMDSWKKFAKNVKLKILLRQSKVTDASIRTFVDAELQSLATANAADFYLQNVVINPGFNNSNAATPNPMYTNYGFSDFSGSAMNTNGWRLYRTAEYYGKNVNGLASSFFPGIGDRRAPKTMGRANNSTATIAPSNIVGRRQGAPKPAGTNEMSYAFLGWKFAGNQDVYKIFYVGDPSGYSNAANNGAGMDGYLALASENRYLLAEAATLYPSIFSFDAFTQYQQGVVESFVFYETGADAATSTAHAQSYLGALNSTVGGWAGAPNHIAAIQLQRFISLANLRQVETYINFLKTGYPAIPVADNAIYPNKPYRLIYPASEYTGNSSNVPNISQAQCFTKNNTTPFWNQN